MKRKITKTIKGILSVFWKMQVSEFRSMNHKLIRIISWTIVFIIMGLAYFYWFRFIAPF